MVLSHIIKIVFFYEWHKVMLITIYQHFHKLHEKQLQIYINDRELQNVRVEKLLGVNIDQNMSWQHHTDKVHRTISMILARFRHIKPFLPLMPELNSASILYSHI